LSVESTDKLQGKTTGEKYLATTSAAPRYYFFLLGTNISFGRAEAIPGLHGSCIFIVERTEYAAMTW
jgi:hypothetical protein